MNLKEIEEKSPKAFDHFKKWFEINYKDVFKPDMTIPNEIIVRSMYNYFDEIGIVTIVKNKYWRGSNLWNCIMVIDKPAIRVVEMVKQKTYDSRIEAEEIVFSLAFGRLEKYYNKFFL